MFLLRIQAECSNHLSYQGQTFAGHVFGNQLRVLHRQFCGRIIDFVKWTQFHFIGANLAPEIFYDPIKVICGLPGPEWRQIFPLRPPIHSIIEGVYQAAIPLKSIPMSRHLPEMPTECQTVQMCLPLTALALRWHCADFNCLFSWPWWRHRECSDPRDTNPKA